MLARNFLEVTSASSSSAASTGSGSGCLRKAEPVYAFLGCLAADEGNTVGSFTHAFDKTVIESARPQLLFKQAGTEHSFIVALNVFVLNCWL